MKLRYKMKYHINKKELKPSLFIKSIKLNNEEEVPFNNDDIVIFVGGNNVGKSRLLKDIEIDLINDSYDEKQNKIIIKDIKYEELDFGSEEILNFFESKYAPHDNYGNYNVELNSQNGYSFSKNDLAKWPYSNNQNLYKCFYTFLTTENRLLLTKSISNQHPINTYALKIMKKLETNEPTLTNINQYLIKSFGKGIEVDTGSYNPNFKYEYKIGKKTDVNKIKGLEIRDAKCKINKMDSLESQGDGIRSAVGILSSLIADNYTIFLIDEPETFMHPPQSRLLGNYIVDLSIGKQCFIATHNIDVIKGLIEKNSVRVKIIKIERFENENSFHLIDNESIKELATDRNLRYTNILNGLFYKNVVLCENESDCKFYSAILESVDEQIYNDTLFCGVAGKEQFKSIIPLLIKSRINYKIIADIDLINSKDLLRNLLENTNKDCQEILEHHERFLSLFKLDKLEKKQSEIKRNINNLFTTEEFISRETKNKMLKILKSTNSFEQLKTKGISVLPEGKCQELYLLLKEDLKLNNIYILDNGELENFCNSINSKGNKWVEQIFNQYEDINNPVYDEARKFIKYVFDIK